MSLANQKELDEAEWDVIMEAYQTLLEKRIKPTSKQKYRLAWLDEQRRKIWG